MISTNRRPAAAIAWLLAIILVPVLGLLLFWLLGTRRLPASRRADQVFVTERMLERVPTLNAVGHRDEWPSWLASTTRLNKHFGALPMVGGNALQLIEGYTESFDAMITQIDLAQSFIHVEFYILVLDDATRPFFEALARAAARGVTVRVLTDHLGSVLNANRRETALFLTGHEIEWHVMLPVRPLRGQWQRPDMRNHRKLLVIDGSIGFTGSQNLIADDYNKRKNIKRGLHWVELNEWLQRPVRYRVRDNLARLTSALQ